MIAEKRPQPNPGKGNMAVVFRRGGNAKTALLPLREKGPFL